MTSRVLRRRSIPSCLNLDNINEAAGIAPQRARQRRAPTTNTYLTSLLQNVASGFSLPCARLNKTVIIGS
jgi:hypothetical protein